MRLQLERPLVVFDLETTGIDPATDRIVEIAVLRIDPDGSREMRTRRIHPGRPIPPAATAVHGIRDEDVASAPTFAQVARSLLEFLGEADLAGFNVVKFDVPLLERELRDCGLDLGVARRRIVDAMTIFHRKEPRHLSAAVRFYLGREHDGAHAAEADVAAAAEILEAQLERYPDVPSGVAALDAWLRGVPADALDQGGKLVWRDGEAVLAFGRHRGQTLRALVTENPAYLSWLLGADFPADTKQIVARALRGELPEPPAPATARAPDDQST